MIFTRWLSVAAIIDGVRIDHIDGGLFEPAAYLADLRRRVPAPLYIAVEKDPRPL